MWTSLALICAIATGKCEPVVTPNIFTTEETCILDTTVRVAQMEEMYPVKVYYKCIPWGTDI